MLIYRSNNKILHFGDKEDSLRIKFNRRTVPYSMASDHCYRDYEIYYLFSGERNYFIQDTIYPVQAGDLVLINSKVVHKPSELCATDHERIVLYLAPSYFKACPPVERDLLLSPSSQDHQLSVLVCRNG